MLLTKENSVQHHQYIHSRNSLLAQLSMGAIPVINENDSVATEEIVIGDNDTLAAIVATSAKAELLVLLSDIDGLYTADPKKDPSAALIREVSELTDDVLALAGDKGSDLGTGGMKTKLSAAGICMNEGCDMIIANGSDPTLLYDIADGKPVGTRFLSNRSCK